MTTTKSKSDGGSGRPRRPETDAAILDATRQLFAEMGAAGMSMEAVAAKAGVGKTTIYRRWPSKDELIIAAIRDVISPLVPSDTGDIREDLVGLTTLAVQFLNHSSVGAMFPRMAGEVADRTPLGRRYVEEVIAPRRSQLRLLLTKAIERRQIRADLNVAQMADAIIGPIILRKILGDLDTTADQELVDLIDSLLEGWRQR
jgi:AcrR family transcriptional regulator